MLLQILSLALIILGRSSRLFEVIICHFILLGVIFAFYHFFYVRFLWVMIARYFKTSLCSILVPPIFRFLQVFANNGIACVFAALILILHHIFQLSWFLCVGMLSPSRRLLRAFALSHIINQHYLFGMICSFLSFSGLIIYYLGSLWILSFSCPLGSLGMLLQYPVGYVFLMFWILLSVVASLIYYSFGIVSVVLLFFYDKGKYP